MRAKDIAAVYVPRDQVALLKEIVARTGVTRGMRFFTYGPVTSERGSGGYYKMKGIKEIRIDARLRLDTPAPPPGEAALASAAALLPGLKKSSTAASLLMAILSSEASGPEHARLARDALSRLGPRDVARVKPWIKVAAARSANIGLEARTRVILARFALTQGLALKDALALREFALVTLGTKARYAQTNLGLESLRAIGKGRPAVLADGPLLRAVLSESLLWHSAAERLTWQTGDVVRHAPFRELAQALRTAGVTPRAGDVDDTVRWAFLMSFSPDKLAPAKARAAWADALAVATKEAREGSEAAYLLAKAIQVGVSLEGPFGANALAALVDRIGFDAVITQTESSRIPASMISAILEKRRLEDVKPKELRYLFQDGSAGKVILEAWLADRMITEATAVIAEAKPSARAKNLIFVFQEVGSQLQYMSGVDASCIEQLRQAFLELRTAIYAWGEPSLVNWAAMTGTLYFKLPTRPADLAALVTAVRADADASHAAKALFIYYFPDSEREIDVREVSTILNGLLTSDITRAGGGETRNKAWAMRLYTSLRAELRLGCIIESLHL